MKVAAYIRTATNDMENYKQQLNAIHKYCEGKGYLYTLYEDVASSGSKKGEQLAELINKVDEYDLVIVVSVERLTRDYLVFRELRSELRNTFKDKLIVLNNQFKPLWWGFSYKDR